MMKPTQQQFQAFQVAFDHFNRELFEGALPHVLLNFTRRGGGFFATRRWAFVAGKKTRLHEISINPEKRPDLAAGQTLVHEMVHLWQHEHGSTGRAGYHNAQWAEKMRGVGLDPVFHDASRQRVSEKVIEQGTFAAALKRLPAAARLPLCVIVDKHKNKSKTHYQCSGCEVSVWGRPGIRLTCADCARPFAVV